MYELVSIHIPHKIDSIDISIPLQSSFPNTSHSLIHSFHFHRTPFILRRNMNHGTNTDTNQNYDDERHHDHGHLPHRIHFHFHSLHHCFHHRYISGLHSAHITSLLKPTLFTLHLPLFDRDPVVLYISLLCSGCCYISVFILALSTPHTPSFNAPSHSRSHTCLLILSMRHITPVVTVDNTPSMHPLPHPPYLSHKSLTVSGPFAGYPRLPYSCTNCKLPH